MKIYLKQLRSNQISRTSSYLYFRLDIGVIRCVSIASPLGNKCLQTDLGQCLFRLMYKPLLEDDKGNLLPMSAMMTNAIAGHLSASMTISQVKDAQERGYIDVNEPKHTRNGLVIKALITSIALSEVKGAADYILTALQ